MKLRKFLIVAVLSAFAFTSCQDNDKKAEEERLEMERMEAEREAEMLEQEEQREWEANSIAARVEENPDLSTFRQGMNNAQAMVIYQTEEGPFTVFAPANAAFEQVPQAQRDEMMDPQNRDKTNASFSYLVVPGEFTSDQLKQEIQNNNGTYVIKTLQGEDLTASLEGDVIVLKDPAGKSAKVTQADLDASNGVIHVIDMVLLPKDPTRNDAANMMMQSMDTTGTRAATDSIQ